MSETAAAQLADAINNLATAVHKLADYPSLSHELCMGLRNGLFGGSEPSRNNLADSLTGLESAVNAVATVMEQSEGGADA